MPTYEYFCDTCSHSFDIKQRFHEDALTTCPACNQETLRKVFHASSIVFKGSGFYKTDNQDRSKKTPVKTTSTPATESKEATSASVSQPAPTTNTTSAATTSPTSPASSNSKADSTTNS
jgi:putative FmdB family regulatory protein